LVGEAAALVNHVLLQCLDVLDSELTRLRTADLKALERHTS
jgi:hypothetical protein